MDVRSLCRPIGEVEFRSHRGLLTDGPVVFEPKLEKLQGCEFCHDGVGKHVSPIYQPTFFGRKNSKNLKFAGAGDTHSIFIVRKFPSIQKSLDRYLSYSMTSYLLSYMIT